MDKIAGLPEARAEEVLGHQDPMPRLLTIAGSDSGGGAGIQADLKTFTALKTFGMSTITALTSQNTLGVNGVHAVPVDFISSQIRDVITDIGVDAIKTGMLHSKEVIETVVDTLQDLKADRPIIVDPVMVSTSGHRLLNEDALIALKEKLIPITTVITPNIPEAELLVGGKISNLQDMMHAALELDSKGALVKGGHLAFSAEELKKSISQLSQLERSNVSIHGDDNIADVIDKYGQFKRGSSNKQVVVDVLYQRTRAHFDIFVQPLVESTNTHGTGCTLSAALAAYLGKGLTVVAAVKAAINFTRLGIEFSLPMGGGNGPLNHTHSTRISPLQPPTHSFPSPFTSHLISAAGKYWDEYIYHPFVQQLGDGTLPKESFLHYITQDYVYLIHYARIHSLAGYKSNSFADLEAFASITKHIAQESTMHVQYCNSWGISTAELLKTIESPHNIAYTRYLTDVGHSGTLLDLLVAVASCLLGYGEIGRRLKASAVSGEKFLPGVVCKKDNNPYWKWIEDYASDDFQDAVFEGIATLERKAVEEQPSEDRLEHLTSIFTRCCQLESGFWDMGLHRL